MANFVEAARVDELPPGKGTCVTVAGKDIALFNVEDACLHQGLSLGTSDLHGKVVTCRGHGWRYNVTTGCTLNVPDYGVMTYSVKIEGGTIFVDTAPQEPAS